MAEETKQPVQPRIEWVEPQGGAVELYANNILATWSLYDVRLLIGMLKPVKVADIGAGFVVEKQGALTMAWPEVKVLRNILTDLISSYEKVNGDIKQPVLAPTPPPRMTL